MVLGLATWPLSGGVRADVLINEIMYHPVEKAAFDAAGDPVLELTDDVHEFIELRNTGDVAVAMAGWRLAGGVTYVFPAGASLPAGGFAVVAKDPARLEAVAGYALAGGSVWGPWEGKLSNDGESVRLENLSGSVVDAVSYGSEAPWPIGANALGAESEWTGVDESQHQYRGRSLERVAVEWPSNDPANWLASPLEAGPSPGRANAVTRPAPLPVVRSFEAVQESTGSVIIRDSQAVRVEARFSSMGAGVTAVQVEYFKDETNATNEVPTVVAMTPDPGISGRWQVVLPGQANRSLVRYRIRADRGEGVGVVSPRPGDPLAWHAYFVTPVRSGTKPQYDVFVASASVSRLAANINGSPRRIVNPDPPGLPRAAWNATEPAVLVRDGRVIDVRIRHHGSRYNRNSIRASFKIQFPRYERLDGAEGMFFKDKGDDHLVGTRLYRAAGLPSFDARYVDFYLNNNSVRQRLQVPEMDERHFEKFAQAQARLFPGTEVEASGEFYKASGVVPFETAGGIGATSVYTSSGEGPYYIGNCAPIPAKTGWRVRQRYDWTYGVQMHSWIGGRDTEAMITGLWEARGDAPTAPDPDVSALRQWLETHFDVDATLRYIAIRNWCAPFDNATHNYFLWRRANGRWAMLPWDLDGELVTSTKSIFWDEHEVPQPDTLRGPQWIKDSFLKAYREEYRRTLWLLNNTILLPARFGPSGYGGVQSFATARHTNVNAQLGFGTFYRPVTPTPMAPAAGAQVLPGAALRTSAYAHGAPAAAPAHASTTWIIRAAGAAWETPVVHLTSTIHLTSLPIPFDSLVFGTTYSWKCVHTDADGHPSFESAQQSFTFGVPSGGVPELRLNEIFARGSGPDFIELHNAGSMAAELSGMGLTDNPSAAPKWVFQAGTVLAPGAYHVVTLDAAAPFRLDGDGQTVVMLEADGTLADAVSFGPQAADWSIGRSGDGWSLGAPTPGQANLVETTGPPSGLRVNEWMAANPGGSDWFEVVNPGAQPVSLSSLKLGNGSTTTILPALSFIGGGGFQRFIADREPGPHHVDFRLSSSGESILLSDESGTVIDSVTFGPQASAVSEGRLPDGTGPIVRFPGHATPGEPNALGIDDVVVSRVFPDLEFYNKSAVPVVIDGWELSDGMTGAPTFVIPSGFGAVPAGQTRVLSAAVLPFSMDRRRGGEIHLTHSGTHRSRRIYGAWDGHPYGLVTRPAGDVFVRVNLAPPTPNNVPVVGPVVVSQINFHPPDLPGDDSVYEFVEWLNTSDQAIDIGEWRLDGDAVLTVPVGTLLPAGGRVVLAAVGPADFAARYDVGDGALVFGPWTGGLPNSGGQVRLVRRLAPVTEQGPDFGYRPEVVLEDIRYDDATPWPVEADGAGPALVRSGLSAYADDAAHWTAIAPAPGRDPGPNVTPTVTLSAPTPGQTVPPGQPLDITAMASDADGEIRQVVLEVNGEPIEAVAQPPFRFAWTPGDGGTFVLRVRAIDGRLASAVAEVTVTVTVINQPPLVALVAPAAGTRLEENAIVTLEAAALDPEGLLQRVEFLIDGVAIGSLTAPPWRMNWTAGPAGHRSVSARAIDVSGLARTASAAAVFVAGSGANAPVIAYRVPAGTVGNQAYTGSLGHDFEVLSPIVVTRLGVFDSGSNGLSSPLTAQIWSRDGTPRRLVSLAFSNADPGQLAAGTSSRFKPLPTRVVLEPGEYSVVAYGYSNSEMNGNASGNAPAWSTSTGGGLIRFTGTARYGSAAQFPATLDGGPVDRYAGPTFEFTTADRDGDYMPLDWELDYGFNPDDPSDGLQDADGDGATNQQEYAAGTEPRQAGSRLAIESIESTPTQSTVRFTLPAHRSATLQSSNELIFWIDRESVSPATNSRTLELNVPNQPNLYLRVLVNP
ncbi:MAG: lamin tail domain-containing protein [Verrucomicrobiales bacterium]